MILGLYLNIADELSHLSGVLSQQVWRREPGFAGRRATIIRIDELCS